MIRKACFLFMVGALTLLGFAAPAAAGTCTVQCFDLTMSSASEPSGPDCVAYGNRFCADHGGLRAVMFGP